MIGPRDARAVAAIERRLHAAEGRLGALEAAALAAAQGLRADPPGAASLPYTPPSQFLGTPHLVTLRGACDGNPTVDADLYLWAFARDGTGYLAAIVPTVGGAAVLDVPEYYDDARIPFCVACATRYAPTREPLPTTKTSHALALRANNLARGLSGEVQAELAFAPALYLSGSGTGGALLPGGAIVPGSGYGGGAGVTFDGYYGTGKRADVRVGIVSSASVATPGSNYNSAPAVAVVPAGPNATIRGVAGEHGGVTDWTVLQAGTSFGYPPDGFFVTSNQVQPVPIAPSIRATVAGGAIASIVVEYPGNHYFPNATVTAVAIGGRGSGARVRAVASGGSLSSAVLEDRGSGYYLPPVASISGNASGAIALGRVDGISGLVDTRKPDPYGCFGTLPRPARLQCSLTSPFGTIDLGLGNVQVAYGPTISQRTGPAVRPGYYAVAWQLWRGGTIKYRTVFSGGSLSAILIDDPGYGHASEPAVTILGSAFVNDPLRTGSTGTYTPGTPATFHFTLDAAGSATGYAIDSPGSGYTRPAAGNPPEDRTMGPFLSVEPRRGEYELFLSCPVALINGGQGPAYPFGGIPQRPLLPGAEPTGHLARARAAGYDGPPLAASYDFAGTPAAGPVFQGGPAVVTLSE